jgi:hypothetical protein
MPTTLLLRLKPKLILATALVALPMLAFYGILLDKAINLPLEDDYEALLDFLNHMAELKGVSAKASYFLAAQFNEYKLFFGHAVAWLQFALLGHTDVKVLCAAGNGFVLLIAILLWKMSIPRHKDLAFRLATFIPTSCLLFQLGYAETLNWAMPGLQNLPVILFSLVTIYLLDRATTPAFGGALIGLVLAISASGNGMVVIPVGVLILLVNGCYGRLMIWIAVSTGCIVAYAYRYNAAASQNHYAVLAKVLHPHPIYMLAFFGSVGALPLPGLPYRMVVLLSSLLGLALCAVFVELARRGYRKVNPAASYCVLFLILTSAGVSGLRSELGLGHSLDSRYRIYSVLLLIFVWIAIVEELVQHHSVQLWRNDVYLVACAGAVVFCLIMDVWGWSYLSDRNAQVVTGMSLYEQGSVPSPILPFPNQGARIDELDSRAPMILRQATKLGIYRPPLL